MEGDGVWRNLRIFIREQIGENELGLAELVEPQIAAMLEELTRSLDAPFDDPPPLT